MMMMMMMKDKKLILKVHYGDGEGRHAYIMSTDHLKKKSSPLE